MIARVLTIGGAVQDVVLDYAYRETLNLHTRNGSVAYLLLKEGEKIEVRGLCTSTGGGATNSAVGFARLGFEASVFCKLGCDRSGDFIVTELEKAGVDTQSIYRDPEHTTGSSFVIPSLKGDRTVLAYRGSNATLCDDQVPWERIEGADLLYVTSLSGASSRLLPRILDCARRSGTFVAINPGASQLTSGVDDLLASLANVKILILNSDEAMQLACALNRYTKTYSQFCEAWKPQAGRPDTLNRAPLFEGVLFVLEAFFQAVLGLGPEVVAVTHGEEGVYVASGHQMWFHPSCTVDVVNTLGAGDAFGVGLVGWLVGGYPLEEAICAGVRNSANVIAYPDAKSGLMDKAALEQAMRETPSALVSFPLGDSELDEPGVHTKTS